MSFVERSIILCPYLGGSTIGGFTVLHFWVSKCDGYLILDCLCTTSPFRKTELSKAIIIDNTVIYQELIAP